VFLFDEIPSNYIALNSRLRFCVVDVCKTLYCTFRACNVFVRMCPLFILTHTFLVLVTVGIGHGVYRKLCTLIGGQCAENFENHCCRQMMYAEVLAKNVSRTLCQMHGRWSHSTLILFLKKFTALRHVAVLVIVAASILISVGVVGSAYSVYFKSFFAAA